MTDSDLDAMKMAMVRTHRDNILRLTDPGLCEGGWGSADRPYSEAMLTYRKALRDFPSTITADDVAHTDVEETNLTQYFESFHEVPTEENDLETYTKNQQPVTQGAHVGVDVTGLNWPTAPDEINDHLDVCMDQSKLLHVEAPKPGLIDPEIKDNPEGVQWQGEAWKPENRQTYTQAQLDEKYKDYDTVGVYANGDIATTKIK